MLQSSLFLWRFSCFSLINTPWVATSFGLVFRVLKELILTMFASFFHCFYGEVRFIPVRGLYPVIFTDVHLLSSFWCFYKLYLTMLGTSLHSTRDPISLGQWEWWNSDFGYKMQPPVSYNLINAQGNLQKNWLLPYHQFIREKYNPKLNLK